LITDNWSAIKRALVSPEIVFITSDEAALTRIANSQALDITWEQLLPELERELITKYQAPEPERISDLTDQILRSIEASSDTEYQSAMVSTNTISTFDNAHVSLAGFVVPIEFYDDTSPSLVFLVPYFGACIHFPPPPPNQIVFARLPPNFDQLDINQAYTFEGILQQGLFEDQMGTSAYEMNVTSISLYEGQPDDLRNH
jgi:hypothetical protein